MYGGEPAVRGLDSAPSAGDGAASARARDPYDQLVYQIFSVSLELHVALAHIDNPHAAVKVHHAIGELDDVIDHLRHTIAELLLPVDVQPATLAMDRQPVRLKAGRGP